MSSSSSSPPPTSGDIDPEQNEQDEIPPQECLRIAEELKSEGNDFFRAKEWGQALNAYRTGLARLPKRKLPPKIDLETKLEEDSLDTGSETAKTQNPISADVVSDHIPSPIIPQTELQKECSKARAVLNANIGACYVKLGEHKEAVEACTQALLDDPEYIKALQRRAASNEKLNSWSSLTNAQEDYTKLLGLLPPSAPQVAELKRSLMLLKPRVEAAQKAETAEMLDKLKGLGNSILGNFGLSTDNFKFQPNGQGGYSMNFSQ